jgi:phenylacetate-CoA ligase
MLSTIAKFSEELGIAIGGPKAVFTSSETLLESQRVLIEKAFKCKILDWYGNSELGASIGQCERGAYHVNSEYGIVELNQDVPGREKDTGEMICTSFINHGTPLLRYRIGDLMKLSSTKCACGRGLPVVDSIIGRMDDIIVTPNGVHVGRMDHIFKDALNIGEAQVIQESMEELRVLIVPRRGFNANDLRVLEKEFGLRLGTEMSIKFETVDMIPRESNGKFRSVISKISRGAERV